MFTGCKLVMGIPPNADSGVPFVFLGIYMPCKNLMVMSWGHLQAIHSRDPISRCDGQIAGARNHAGQAFQRVFFQCLTEWYLLALQLHLHSLQVIAADIEGYHFQTLTRRDLEGAVGFITCIDTEKWHVILPEGNRFRICGATAHHSSFRPGPLMLLIDSIELARTTKSISI